LDNLRSVTSVHFIRSLDHSHSRSTLERTTTMMVVVVAMMMMMMTGGQGVE
jgi:hypothetical protein